ncbi:hypothetical protein PIB30_048025 [Stylosanthes scabra]|uniref:Uncharacterized protein n=1 Tax=Stylosanthes scabra TaxID=79078 RepID=A0ABU6YJB5_9FABA|nr:hypothetical protein [Stylosanthes scabra]
MGFFPLSAILGFITTKESEFLDGIRSSSYCFSWPNTSNLEPIWLAFPELPLLFEQETLRDFRRCIFFANIHGSKALGLKSVSTIKTSIGMDGFAGEGISFICLDMHCLSLLPEILTDSRTSTGKCTGSYQVIKSE